jgi:hypothetical protein|nr:MAG TPA: hypothetical protein [Caudoviricetes sp.]
MLDYNTIENGQTIQMDSTIRKLLHQKYNVWCGDMVVFDKGTIIPLIKETTRIIRYFTEDKVLKNEKVETYRETIPPKPLLLRGESSRLPRATLTWEEIRLAYASQSSNETYKVQKAKLPKPFGKPKGEVDKIELKVTTLSDKQIATLKELGIL